MVCHEGTITWLIACADEAVRGPAPGMSSSETVKSTKAAGGRPSLPVTVTSADVVHGAGARTGFGVGQSRATVGPLGGSSSHKGGRGGSTSGKKGMPTVPGGINKAAHAQASAQTQAGVWNGGNTCYQNSIFWPLVKTTALMEVLRHTEETMLDDRHVKAKYERVPTDVVLPHRQLNFKSLLLSLHDGRLPDLVRHLEQFWRDIDSLAKEDDIWRSSARRGLPSRMLRSSSFV
jgi:hypothetical protein